MNYLAVLYDEEHSYEFDEVDLAKVERAMLQKIPFKFSDGTIVAGGDIRRIERAYEEVNQSARIDPPILSIAAPNQETDRSGNFPPKFWRTIWHINTVRVRDKKRMIKNDLIENAFNGTDISDPYEIVDYIIKTHPELEIPYVAPLFRAI